MCAVVIIKPPAYTTCSSAGAGCTADSPGGKPAFERAFFRRVGNQESRLDSRLAATFHPAHGAQGARFRLSGGPRDGGKIIRGYYGEAPRYSYWVGFSTGGRQGFSEAQRYPEDFDGLVIGAPAIDIPGLKAGRSCRALLAQVEALAKIYGGGEEFGRQATLPRTDSRRGDCGAVESVAPGQKRLDRIHSQSGGVAASPLGEFAEIHLLRSVSRPRLELSNPSISIGTRRGSRKTRTRSTRPIPICPRSRSEVGRSSTTTAGRTRR
jgi:pimeloyl-ACP methyl ester carboxylesterase